MRALLVIWLATSLAPGLGEVAESVVHLAASGHLAHSDAAHGDLTDQGDEHGCGTTQHHCGCCASQAVASPVAADVVAGPAPVAAATAAPDPLASLCEPTPPFRPPILA